MYRKGVSALIINTKNEFLLVNLESFEDCFFAIPGGGIEKGETLEAAIYREIREELGIETTSLQLVGQSPTPIRFTFKESAMTRDGKQYAGAEKYVFGFRFVGNDDEIQARKGEIRKHMWVPLADLKNYLLFDNQLQETLKKIAEIFPHIA